jgi:hemerythrin superfamily protein
MSIPDKRRGGKMDDRYQYKDNHARDYALAIVGGLAVGILGSRLLPPMVVQAKETARMRGNGDPFDKLIQDHKLIKATLREMEQTTEGIGARMKLLMTLKRKLGKHAMAEEDVVYPLVHDELRDRNGSKRLYDEHADMKIALYQLEQMVKANQDWTERVRTLRTLIEDHIREEEEVEFPRLRMALDQQSKARTARHIVREEALVL